MEQSQPKTELKGYERVSAFLSLLPEESVKKILTLMSEEEVQKIAHTMSFFPGFSPASEEKILMDFWADWSMRGRERGSLEKTQRFLEKALPKEKVEIIMGEVKKSCQKTIWDQLNQMNETFLAQYLQQEHPQTIAVILGKIQPEQVSKVLALLPDKLNTEVILRFLKKQKISDTALQGIEATLEKDLLASLSAPPESQAYEFVAEVFNGLDRSTEARLFQQLEQQSEEEAEKIKTRMFIFEDMLKLDSHALQMVVRLADKGRLALALKGASDSLKELFFKGMSERAGKILKEDMTAMGMVRLREVEEAQSYLVSLTKELSNTGQISIRRNPEALEEMVG